MTSESSARPDTADTSSPATATPAQQFASILRERGLHDALRFLNSRTRHRFTGAYRFEPPTLRSVALYDRENPTIKVGSDNPMTETYCSILDATRQPFSLEDSSADSRVVSHLARDRVVSYCGVPLFGADGSPRGSICHFDLRPRLSPAAEISLLEEVAPLLLQEIERQLA